jgi:subtilase family serine protease
MRQDYRPLPGLVAAVCAAVFLLFTLPGQAQQTGLMTRHVRDVVANGQAASVGRLPASQTMRFDVVLPLRHEPELDNFLQALYDPSGSSYRHFLTPSEFTERFGPSQEDWDALTRFARENNFAIVGGSRDGMDMQLKGRVADIERAFHVTMGLYQHPTEKRTFFAPDREPMANLPFALWHISGLDNYSIPRPLVRHKDVKVNPNVVKGSCPGNTYCGSDMRAAYYGGTALTGAGQNVGLLEFLGYDIVDVNTYFTNVGQKNNVPVIGVSTDGSNVNCVAPGCDDTEQTLDITQAVSMAPGLTGLYVFVGNSDTAMLSSMSTHTPLVGEIGSSWSWRPPDPTQTDPFFKKFAAQGQNFFQAAGDSGHYTPQSQFVFPGDDPYITVVGGTDLQVTKAGGPWLSETAWVDSGGGIYTPDSFPIPAWQQLPGVINAQNKGSNTIRNSPDVSAESNFDFYVCADQSGCSGGWGGTSFAAPMWAGFMALINQQAIANGNPQLGFINPAIYNIGVSSGYSAAFHDITSGSNGLPAVTGYDLATGWGSPNGDGLISALAGSGTGGGPVVSLSPTSLHWGKKVVGVTSAKKAITLSNTGNATLNINNVTASGDFALAPAPKKKACGATLAAGASCQIKVTFTPTQVGLRTGAVTLTDNAPDSPQTVPLSGTGK